MPQPWPKPPRKVKARKPLKNRRPMKRVNAKRDGSSFPKVKNREFRRWLRTEHACEIWGFPVRVPLSSVDVPVIGADWIHRCWYPIDPVHVGKKQSQGASDVGHCVPLCRAAHHFYDNHRSKWQMATGLSEADMENRAGGYALKYVERGGVGAREQETTT